MPMHDWTRVTPGDFHHFHQAWTVYLTNALNRGGLPPGYMAMTEQVTGRPIPDVVTLQTRGPKIGRKDSGGLAVATAPVPMARVIAQKEKISYVSKKNRVAIRHGRGKVVAIIEIVSPGNKDSVNSLKIFVEKAVDILNQGVNLLVVDPYPPSVRDPEGIHKAIWDQIEDTPFDFLPDKPLTIASYLGGDLPTAYVETIGLGDLLPSMPIFLSDSELDYVPCPLEATYMEAWSVYPEMLKELFEASDGESLPPG